MDMNVGPHIADDVLEKYALRRLTEDELSSVEEHLLVCPLCQAQAEETEQFVLATQAALRSGLKKPVARALHATSAGILHSWFTLPAFAAVMAALAAAIFLPGQKSQSRSTEVRLYAMRGANSSAVHAKAGSKLTLDLDTTGLPPGDYRVQIVDAHGNDVWTGSPKASGTTIQAVVANSLPVGLYWVRLTSSGKPIREYGIEIDR